VATKTNIWVKPAESGVNCLRVFDEDEHYQNRWESGMALRRVIHSDSVTWSAPPNAASLEISFGSPPSAAASPFAQFDVAVNQNGDNTTPIHVTLGALKGGFTGRYKYNIILTMKDGTVYKEDPQVIIDNTNPFVIT